VGLSISNEGQPAGLSVGWFQPRLIYMAFNEILEQGVVQVANEPRNMDHPGRAQLYSCSREPMIESWYRRVKADELIRLPRGRASQRGS